MEMKEVYRTIDAWMPASSATGVLSTSRVCSLLMTTIDEFARSPTSSPETNLNVRGCDRTRPLDFRERATRRGSQTLPARGTPRVDSTTRLAIRGDEEGAREARRTRSRVSFS